MIPFEIPPGTTLEGLVTEILPAAHTKLVPPKAGADRLRVGVHFFGGPAYALTIDGARLTVTEGAAVEPDMWIGSPIATARVFAGDLSGARRFVPKRPPPGDVKLLTDPRALARVKLVTGKIELAVTDFPDVPGGRASLWLCLGPASKRPALAEAADVTIELTTRAFERMTAGSLGPEDALADGDVTISGKRLVAMQLALALAPFFPKP